MTASVPTVEPAELVVGDTWTWQKSLADYPAGTWTLTYYFRSQAGEFSAVASASGGDHLLTIAAATTATYKAGRYQWDARVASGSSSFSVGRGSLVVKPNPAAIGSGFDPRTHARKTLEAIEAVIEKKATRDQMEYAIGTRSLKRMTAEEITKWRDYYRAEVRQEEANERLARGEVGSGRLLARL